MTAQELLKVVNVNRSTLSHHLTKFVEERVFNVRVQRTGRPIKYYQINKDFNEEVIINAGTDEKAARRKMFLESASAHLQAISNMVSEYANVDTSKGAPRRKKNSVTFTFHFISNEEGEIWDQEYATFEQRFNERRKELSTKNSSLDCIVFGGQIPIMKSK